MPIACDSALSDGGYLSAAGLSPACGRRCFAGAAGGAGGGGTRVFDWTRRFASLFFFTAFAGFFGRSAAGRPWFFFPTPFPHLET
jgi:hypothetical protein